MTDLVGAVKTAGQAFGLNLVAAIPAAVCNAAVQRSALAAAPDHPTLSIVICGNGGGDFWRAFTAYADENPGWRQRENPLDDFTRTVIEARVVPAVRAEGVRCTPRYPFTANEPALNFIELARLAGLAGPSILGVVLNPVYGPWIAFRAALLVDIELDAPGPAIGFDPCPGCVPRSCISACPAGAISAGAGWNIPACLTHRVEHEGDCAPRCHARAACVIGPDHRYPDEALAYHQMRALRSMRPYYEAHLAPGRKPAKA